MKWNGKSSPFSSRTESSTSNCQLQEMDLARSVVTDKPCLTAGHQVQSTTIYYVQKWFTRETVQSQQHSGICCREEWPYQLLLQTEATLQLQAAYGKIPTEPGQKNDHGRCYGKKCIASKVCSHLLVFVLPKLNPSLVFQIYKYVTKVVLKWLTIQYCFCGCCECAPDSWQRQEPCPSTHSHCCSMFNQVIHFR